MSDEAAPVIELDLGSFVRSERREIQNRFGHDFATLRRYAYAGLMVSTPADKVLTCKGEPVWPDDVLLFAIYVQRKRADPSAKETDFDDVGLSDLTDAIIATEPAKKARKSSTKKKTSS